MRTLNRFKNVPLLEKSRRAFRYRYYSKGTETLKKFEEIPGPSTTPIIKNWELVRNLESMHTVFDKWFDTYGTIVRFEAPSLGKCVALKDPKDIKKVFFAAGNFARRFSLEPLIRLKEETGRPKGIGELHGVKWKRFRDALWELLQPNIVRTYIPRVNKVSKDWIEYIEKKMNNNQISASQMELFCGEYTFEAFSSIILGLRMGLFSENVPPEVREFVDNAVSIMEMFNKLIYGIPLWKYITTPTWKRFKDTWGILVKDARQIINNKAKYKSVDDNVESFEEILRRQKILTIEEIDDTLIELLFGGIDNTSNAMIWTVLRLAKEEDAQEKIYNEIESIIGDGDIKREHYGKLTYLHDFMLEVQRMNPWILNNVRVLDKEIVIQGYQIPPKTPIFLNLYSPSKCPMYHPNPEKFRPERYRDKTVKYDVYTTMTFGGGAVMCPGRRMAELQLQLGVISLVKNFKMKLIGEIPKAKVTTILSPDFRTSNPTIVFEKRKK